MKRSFVKCAYCGREISKSNLSKHERSCSCTRTINKISYKLNHDGLVCQFCGKELKNRNSLCNHERMCKQNPNHQISNFVAYNKMIKQNGSTAWNAGLTKDSDEKVKKYAETYKLNHLKGLHKDVSGKNNPMTKEENKKKVSDTINKKVKEGKWHTSLAKNMHINYKGVDLHGTWELAYAKYLDSNNIKWSRPTERFEYKYNDTLRHYTPDFYLIDSDTYIEIKGYKTSKDMAKWDQFPKEKKLKIYMHDDLKELGIIL